MTDQQLPLTGNPLKIRNPYKTWGLVRLCLGAALLFLLYPRFPRLTDQLRADSGDFSPMIARIQQSPALVIPPTLLVIASIASLFALITALRSLYWGLRGVLAFFVPVGVPRGIEDAANIVSDFFVNRVIRTYTEPPGIIRKMIHYVSPRFTYATPPQKGLFKAFLSKRMWLVWPLLVGLLSAPRLITAQYAEKIPAGYGWIPVGQSWPLPWPLALVVAGYLAILLFSILASIPRVPRVEVFESREHFESTGNPSNFFNHLQRVFDSMRRGHFPNRRLLMSEPALGRFSQGETSGFEARFIVETQPTPVNRGFAVNAILLDIGGAALICIGFTFLIGIAVFPDKPQAQDLIVAIFRFLGGLLSIRCGAACFALGRQLHGVFRFQSDIFSVRLKGTFTASRIGIGDGRGGQLHSERICVQSDTDSHIYAGRLITECFSANGQHALETDRYLVDSVHNEPFQNVIAHLRQSMSTYDDSGSRLAGVDATAASLIGMVRTNAQIGLLNQNVAALPTTASQEQRALPATQAPEQQETKACPECGEKVMAQARKCRFCGWRFDVEAVQK